MLWHYIRNNMLNHSGKTITDGRASLTYEEIVIYTENFAKKLDEPCYAILCQSEMSAALALLSCLAAGVTAVPLSIKYGEIHCKRILEKINPPFAISDAGGKLHIVDINCGKYVDKPEDRPAVIMCTSGTTGSPKGVMLSRKSLLTNLCDIDSYFDINNEDRILITRPLYHCAVLSGEFLISLVKGLDIVFHSKIFDPITIIKLIREHNITVMCGTPTMFQMLIRYFKITKDPLFLRCIAVSGECLGGECAQIIRAAFPDTQIYHVYGLTEASPRVSYLPPQYFDLFAEYVGLPLPSVQVKIVDDNGNTLPENTEGELCVRGGNLMTGYYQDADMTNKVLENGWLHTNDIASIDEHGFIRIKCRKDDMIIRAGMNIYPQEIENILKSDDRVEEVLAYGIHDAICGEKIGLKVKGNFKNKDELFNLCHEILPTFEIPTVIDLVDEIPKNGSGKIIRIKLNG